MFLLLGHYSILLFFNIFFTFLQKMLTNKCIYGNIYFRWVVFSVVYASKADVRKGTSIVSSGALLSHAAPNKRAL